MDLFHTVTQSLDKVLTCHWFGDFKAFKMTDSNTRGGDKRMDIEPGGEQTQYVFLHGDLLRLGVVLVTS